MARLLTLSIAYVSIICKQGEIMEEEIKTTGDLYLASAYLALSFELTSINRNDPKHMRFTFLGETKEELDEIETKWINRNLVVNAVDFAEAIKRMKSIIHST